MTKNKRVRRFWIGLGLALFITILGFGIANALIPTWGSTPEEQAYVLPGDEIFTHPVLKWNHAITITAPPEEVWKWIAQVGDTRAGYYSYRYIEKAVTAMSGVDTTEYYRNINAIHPEWQTPPDGQGMIMDVLVLREFQPGQYMVAGPKEENSEAGLLWTWAIRPLENGQTRLLVHMRIQLPGAEGNQAIETALNLTTFMMERKMMDGIRLHAEGGTEADWVQIAEALIWFGVLAIGIAAAFQFINKLEWKLPLYAGLGAVSTLFVLVYLQPALWLRIIIAIALASILCWDAIRRQVHSIPRIRQSSQEHSSTSYSTSKRSS